MMETHDTVYVDGIELNEAELEAWQERFAICIWDGLVNVD